jgi:hypothetical protein
MNSKILNLSIACGTECDFSEVASVSTPQPEYGEGGRLTWQPVAHDYLVESFRAKVAETDGLEIVNESHTLHRNGLRYFGLFQIQGINRKHGDEIGTVFGLRNSHDKSCRAGIMAGDAPFVCTNMIFRNEIVLGRRHTVNVFNDLPFVLSAAIGKLMASWIDEDARISRYKSVDLDDRLAHDLILRSFRAGACGQTQISKVLEQWHKPEHDEFSGRTLWSLQNAFTNVYRDNLLLTPQRSEALFSVFDPFAKSLTVSN